MLNYIEYLLPFFSSLKVKEVLILHDGEIKGMGKHFSFVLMESYSHPWTWSMCSFHSNSWVINLSSSRSTFMSHFTPVSHSKNTSSFLCIMYGILLIESILPSHLSCLSMFKGILLLQPTYAVTLPSFVSVISELVP